MKKIIKNYEEYMIDYKGEITRIVGKKGCKAGRILKTRLDTKGYPYVCLCKNGISKKHRVHRLLAFHFIDNPEKKEYVNHIDGNRTNNSLDNLEWVTKSENTIHGYYVSKNMKPPSLGKIGKYRKNTNYFYIEHPNGEVFKFGSTHECFVKTGIDHAIIGSAKKRGLKTYTFVQGKVKGLKVHFDLIE